MSYSQTFEEGAPIRYGQAEPWKKVANAIGRTKPTRAPEKQRSKRYTNDGRPPDTLKELLSKVSKPALTAVPSRKEPGQQVLLFKPIKLGDSKAKPSIPKTMSTP